MSKNRKRKVVYLHGYSKKEQNRLYEQARLLEEFVYKDIDFKNSQHIIEVGCGVGAQTEILLERFPHLKITGVDLSAAQLTVAQKRLKKYIKTGQVELAQLNGEEIHKIPQKFDGAFICWFLEHVPNPEKVIRSLKKVLKTNSPAYFTEVHNAGFFINPYSPNILKYWFEFNDFQWEHGGNPFMGAILGNLLKKTHYRDICLEVKDLFFDERTRRQKQIMLRHFYELIMSSEEVLKKDRRVTQKNINGVKKEVQKLITSRESVYHLDFIQVLARA